MSTTGKDGLRGKESITKVVFDSRTLQFLIPLILILIPVFFYFGYIIVYGVNVLYMDDWGLVWLLDKFNQSNLGFSDLFSQHNEHRIFFPRIAFLFLGNFSHLNSKRNMYFSAILLVLILVIIFFAWMRYTGFNKWSLLEFVPVPYLLFSLIQYENTLWGFQIAFYMVILFAVLSFDLLERGFLIPSIISGIIASFSAIQGLLVWPVGILFLYISRKFNINRNWKKNTFIWIISGIAIFFLYFFDYHKPVRQLSGDLVISHPIGSISYFLSIIGAPVVFTSRYGDFYLAIFFGAMIFILYCIFIMKNLTLKNLPIFYLPLSMIFFSLFFDIANTFGRSGWGVEHSFMSRYTTYGIAGLIGLYLSMLVVLNFKKEISIQENYMTLLIVVIILINLIVSIQIGLVKGEEIKMQRMEANNVLHNIENATDSEIKTYLNPNVTGLKHFSAILKDRGYMNNN